jgi:hypothetical protein
MDITESTGMDLLHLYCKVAVGIGIFWEARSRFNFKWIGAKN